MRLLVRLVGIAASVGLTGGTGAIFLAGFACGQYYAAKALADARAKGAADSSTEAKMNGSTRKDLGRPPTPARRSLSNGWPRAESPCTSDTGSDNGDTKSSGQENYRIVLVVRMDLKMSKQKIGSLLCHAALGQFKKLHKTKNRNLWEWEHDGCSTVILRVPDEESLTDLKASAKTMGIPTHTVIDRGSAHSNPVRTVMAVGPAKSDVVSEVTKHLTLW